MAACHNYKSLAGVRFMLGVVEAGFAPGVAFYLSSWYRRYELASRFALYYTATAISGAFSGLLAGLITQHLNGRRGLQGWQWLFLIEGVGSSGLGFITWYFMPDWPSTTKWLSSEEQILAAQRLAYDGLGNTQGAEGHTGHWASIKMVFADWRTYAFIVLCKSILRPICCHSSLISCSDMLCTGCQTIQYFVPTLVANLGYKGFQAQYHTIPLYACAFVFILVFCFTADRFENKPTMIFIAAWFGTLMFILTVAITNKTSQYVTLIFAFGAVYALPPLILTWVPNVLSHPVQKRAVAIALVNGLGNSASIYGVFLWPAKDAPRYVSFRVFDCGRPG